MNPIYERVPWLLIARRNVARTPVRSALAALGIVIGVLAIASLGVFGATLQFSVTQNLGNIGNDLTVSPATSQGVQSLTDRDVRDVERAVGSDVVVPVKQDQGVVSYGRERSIVPVYGIDRPGGYWRRPTAASRRPCAAARSSGRRSRTASTSTRGTPLRWTGRRIG